MDTLFDVLHVVCAVFIVGAMAGLPMVAMRSIRSGQSASLGPMIKSVTLFTWLSLLAVFFGFALMGVSKYDLSITTPWILYSIIAYVIAILLNLLVVIPAMRRAYEATPAAVAAGDTLPGDSKAAADGAYSRIAMSSGIVSLLLVFIVVMMVWKP